MDSHLITGKVVIDEETASVIDHQVFRKRGTCAHHHAANHLAACG